MEPVITQYSGDPEHKRIDTYISRGGYEAAKKALTSMKPEEVVEVVKASGLRGRGGAGFPTGQKWSFLPPNIPTRYLVVNGDESEPATFKDRLILETNPHLALEGVLIASYAIRSSTCFFYIRGEFTEIAELLRGAIQDAYKRGFFGENILGTGYKLDVALARGAGAYICGEETGLLESLEGRRGQPRVKPPFPAIRGLFGQRTIVNNVETLACVPLILSRGSTWFASIGPPKSPGPRLFSISGRVNKPGVYEAPMGLPAEEMIKTYGGGVAGGKKLKGIIPGGSSSAVLGPGEFSTLMDFDSLARIGSMMGSAGMVALDEDVCPVDTLLNIMRFYAHESCGQCTPCREGSAWSVKLLRKFETGGAEAKDLALIDNVCDMITGRALCPLADGAAMPLGSFSKKYRAEFETHLKEGRCPYPSRD